VPRGGRHHSSVRRTAPRANRSSRARPGSA
jgi:hypothetical protein